MTHINETLPDRKRKSVPLTPEERKQLKRFVESQTSQQDAADLLGLKRRTLATVLAVGRGNSDTIGVIRSKIYAN